MYTSTCSFCGGYQENLPIMETGGDWDKLLESIAKDLYTEKVNKGFINDEIYNRNANALIKGLHEGMGGKSFAYDDERNILKAYLEQNIYKFSAAKSLAEMEMFRSFMINPDGKLASWEEFRNKVIEAGYKFNETYLKTEYNTALHSALMAVKWKTLSESSDYLEYSTAKDDRVRPTHEALDGLTLPTDSPVWAIIWPPVDWNCRCTVVPGIKENVTMSNAEAGKLGDFIKPYFRNNSGKTKVIYKNNHPYFIDHNFKESQLEAVKNYGLKTPTQIFADPKKLSPYEHLNSLEEYYAWWDKHFGNEKAIVEDIQGTKVDFSYLKNHILEKPEEKRFEYAANLLTTFKHPDEIWGFLEYNKLTNVYLKYFEDGNAYAIIVHEKDNLKANSFYKLTETRLKQFRRGILKFHK